MQGYVFGGRAQDQRQYYDTIMCVEAFPVEILLKTWSPISRAFNISCTDFFHPDKHEISGVYCTVHSL